MGDEDDETTQLFREVSRESGSIQDISTSKCARKCVKRGDKICYSELEGTEILKKLPEEPSRTSSHKSIGSDSVKSGESAFKTFTFNPKDSSPDMKKCMSFWKTVLEKNLRPIRCTLIEKKKPKQRKTSSQIKPEDVSQDAKELQAQELWVEAFKEIQNRKLDQIRLTRTEQTQAQDKWAYLVEFEKEDDSVAAQQREEIRKLNSWMANKTEEEKARDLRKRTLSAFSTTTQSTTIPHTVDAIILESKKKGITSPEAKTPTLSLQSGQVNEETSQQPQQINNGDTSKPSDASKKSTSSASPRVSVRVSPRASIKAQKISHRSIKSSQDATIKSGDVRDGAGHVEENSMRSLNLEDESEFDPKSMTKPGGMYAIKEEDQQSESASKNDESPRCTCGCPFDECLCKEVEEDIVAPLFENPAVTICPCGCELGDCNCEKLMDEICRCGCGLFNCLCREDFKVDQKIKNRPEGCLCGCGLLNCDCEKLLEGMPGCKCDQADCRCEENIIYDMFHEQSRAQAWQPKRSSIGTQLALDPWPMKVDKRAAQGVYCAICGHYNCYCKQECKQ